MTAQTRRRDTADEFAWLRDWKNWELVEGRLVPFRCGAWASYICGLGSSVRGANRSDSRADGTCEEMGEAGALSGENVLPGFTCAVAELFV
jgi:hypothetical protein